MIKIKIFSVSVIVIIVLTCFLCSCKEDGEQKEIINDNNFVKEYHQYKFDSSPVVVEKYENR